MHKSTDPREPKSETLYDILGVSPKATKPEIRKAYQRQTRRYHPDTRKKMSEEEAAHADERIRLINDAYAVLSDAAKRKTYDETGDAGMATQHHKDVRISVATIFMEILNSHIGKSFDGRSVFTTAGCGGDMVGKLRAEFDRNETLMKKDKAEKQDRSRLLKELKKRIIVDDGHDNFLADAVDKEVAGLEQAVSELDVKLAFLIDMREAASPFRFTEEHASPVTPTLPDRCVTSDSPLLGQC